MIDVLNSDLAAPAFDWFVAAFMGPRNFGIQHEGSPFKAPRKVFKTLRNVRSKFRATYQRTTKKGQRMAWLTLADGTAAIECSLFPNAYERLGQTGQAQSSLREGAFLVARGRVARIASGAVTTRACNSFAACVRALSAD
jgi:DNA polymerase III alpha subunit